MYFTPNPASCRSMRAHSPLFIIHFLIQGSSAEALTDSLIYEALISAEVWRFQNTLPREVSGATYRPAPREDQVKPTLGHLQFITERLFLPTTLEHFQHRGQAWEISHRLRSQCCCGLQFDGNCIYVFNFQIIQRKDFI